MDAASTRRAVERLRPDIIVHSAAYYGGLGICIAEPTQIFSPQRRDGREPPRGGGAGRGAQGHGHRLGLLLPGRRRRRHEGGGLLVRAAASLRRGLRLHQEGPGGRPPRLRPRLRHRRPDADRHQPLRRVRRLRRIPLARRRGADQEVRRRRPVRGRPGGLLGDRRPGARVHLLRRRRRGGRPAAQERLHRAAEHRHRDRHLDQGAGRADRQAAPASAARSSGTPPRPTACCARCWTSRRWRASSTGSRRRASRPAWPGRSAGTSRTRPRPTPGPDRRRVALVNTTIYVRPPSCGFLFHAEVPASSRPVSSPGFFSLDAPRCTWTPTALARPSSASL